MRYATFALLVAILSLQVIALVRQGRAQSPQQLVTNPPDAALLTMLDYPSKGSATAKLVLVEFSDYECPFCTRHAQTVGKTLDQTYVDTGKLRVMFVDNPLPIHAQAKPRAIAAYCAGQQGRFWDMHDALFAGQDAIDGLNPDTFAACVDNPDSEVRVMTRAAMAQKMKIYSTPTFILGIDLGGHKVKPVKYIHGAAPFEIFKKEIEAALTI
jgi:protein-disulfide isomerase